MAVGDIDEATVARFKSAMDLHMRGRLDEAEALYGQVLERVPAHFDALHNLGVLKLERRDHDAALRLLRQALAINPRAASAHLNIGNVLRDLKNPAEAIVSYNEAIAIAPEYAQAYNNRGVALRDLSRSAEAVESYAQALRLRPKYAEALCNCSTALLDLKRFADALVGAQQALALRADYMEAHLNCGHALYGLRRYPEAVASYREALKHGGNKADIHYYLAALGAEPSPAESPKAYVEGLFDHYAETFDTSLIGLKYNVPERMYEAVAAAWGADRREIADLGCGTGMCGPLFKPLARTLVGVDLSSNMLQKAGERGVYDRLVKADVVGFLRENPGAFDLIIAADVFVYIGDLDAVFAATRAALRPQGQFAFSVEGHDGEGFVIRKSRRYAHALGYLQSLAGKHGFAIHSSIPMAVRQEESQDIDGFTVLLTAR